MPIRPTTTECGVYVCLMALQHACKPGFMFHEYVNRFCNRDRTAVWYELEKCYWMAGRKIIFEVCKRYFRPLSNEAQVESVEMDINHAFQTFYDPILAEAQTSRSPTHHMALSSTLEHVTGGLKRLIDSIGGLDSIGLLQENETIQNRAREVDLTPAGEPHRDDIMKEAVEYAWHDVEAIRNLRADLMRAVQGLNKELQDARVRLNDRVWAARWREAARCGTLQRGPQVPRSMVHHPRPTDNGSAGSLRRGSLPKGCVGTPIQVVGESAR